MNQLKHQKKSLVSKGFLQTKENTQRVNNLYLDKEIANSSQPVGNARLGLPQPVVIRDADVVDILKERIFAGENQLIQTL